MQQRRLKPYRLKLGAGRALLTVGGFGVVLPEGLVFGNVREQEAQRVLGNVLGGHHLVRADDVGQGDGRQLFLGVRLHRVVERLVCVERNHRVRQETATRKRASSPALLTVDVMLNPGEGDGSLTAALAEPQQEGARTLVAQQGLLPLLTEEAHDGAAGKGKKTTHSHRDTHLCYNHASLRNRDSPVVPEGKKVSLNQIQDSFDPQPEGKRFLVGTLLRRLVRLLLRYKHKNVVLFRPLAPQETLRQMGTSTSHVRKTHYRKMLGVYIPPHSLPCRTWSRGFVPQGSSWLWLLQRNTSHINCL